MEIDDNSNDNKNMNLNENNFEENVQISTRINKEEKDLANKTTLNTAAANTAHVKHINPLNSHIHNPIVSTTATANTKPKKADTKKNSPIASETSENDSELEASIAFKNIFKKRHK